MQGALLDRDLKLPAKKVVPQGYFNIDGELVQQPVDKRVDFRCVPSDHDPINSVVLADYTLNSFRFSASQLTSTILAIVNVIVATAHSRCPNFSFLVNFHVHMSKQSISCCDHLHKLSTTLALVTSLDIDWLERGLCIVKTRISEREAHRIKTRHTRLHIRCTCVRADVCRLLAIWVESEVSSRYLHSRVQGARTRFAPVCTCVC